MSDADSQSKPVDGIRGQGSFCVQDAEDAQGSMDFCMMT